MIHGWVDGCVCLTDRVYEVSNDCEPVIYSGNYLRFFILFLFGILVLCFIFGLSKYIVMFIVIRL